MKIEFIKMNGLGNDYVFIDKLNEYYKDEEHSNLVKKISNRNFGVGSDGVVFMYKSKKSDCYMQMYNKDGSQGQMCGNAIRCIAKYLYEYDKLSIIKKDKMLEQIEIKIETVSGNKNLMLMIENNKVVNITVNMGKPNFNVKSLPAIFKKDCIIDELIDIGDYQFKITCVSVGNPHAVIIINKNDYLFNSNIIEKIGSKIENLEMFPEKINVHFVKFISENEIQIIVWERGSGRTLACGTGACAAIACLIKNKLCIKDTDILVHLEGGDLNISQSCENDNIYMTGKANIVFKGEYYYENK